MKKYLKIFLCGLLLTGLIAASAPAQHFDAEEIHFDAVVVDTHNDTMMRVVNSQTWLPVNDIGVPTTRQLDIPKMEAGGLDVPFFAAYQTDYGIHARNISRVLALNNALHWTVGNNSDVIGIATSLKEIHELVKKGKIAAVPTIEGGYSLRPSEGIELLNQFYDLGVRAMALTWSVSNLLGEGVNKVYFDGSASSGGLTDFGWEVIAEMNRLGMIVDVSHMHVDTFWEAVAATKAPIIASHSSVYSLVPHMRNLKDDQIIALANTGGVVQIAFAVSFLANPGETATIAKLVDHIEYVINLVGIDHVGLGSDFDGTTVPADLQNAAGLPKITEELVSRGYSKPEIDKILGGNALRVLGQVQLLAENSPDIVGQAPAITPTLTMGQVITSPTPVLTAQVDRGTGSLLDVSSFRVILDGNVYIPEYDAQTGIVSFEVTVPLTTGQNGFHVVTFKAANIAQKVARATKTFYVQAPPP